MREAYLEPFCFGASPFVRRLSIFDSESIVLCQLRPKGNYLKIVTFALKIISLKVMRAVLL